MNKAVIFDVDGTLYDQRRLRRQMVLDLLKWGIGHPQRIKDLLIIRNFRRQRELFSWQPVVNIAHNQYLMVAKTSGVSPEKVRLVIHEWMSDKPLTYLPDCRFNGTRRFFDFLRTHRVTIGIFSDFPAEKKLAALELAADCIICATDPDVDRLKPDPKGLSVIARKLNLSITDCLFIGDKDEKDGECARRVGMPYIIMGSKKKDFYQSAELFDTVRKRLDI